MANTPLMNRMSFGSFLPQFVDTADIRPQGGGNIALFTGGESARVISIGKIAEVSDEEKGDLDYLIDNTADGLAACYQRGEREVIGVRGVWSIDRVNSYTGKSLHGFGDSYAVSLFREADGCELSLGVSARGGERYVAQGYRNELGRFSYGIAVQRHLRTKAPEIFTTFHLHLNRELLEEARAYYGLGYDLASLVSMIAFDAQHSGILLQPSIGDIVVDGPQSVYVEPEDFDWKSAKIKNTCSRQVEVMKSVMHQTTTVFAAEGFYVANRRALDRDHAVTEGLSVSAHVFDSAHNAHIVPLKGRFAQFCRAMLKKMGAPLFPLIGAEGN